MAEGSIRVVFMGTSRFAVPSLEALVHVGYQVVGVVSQTPKPAGRGRKFLSQSNAAVNAVLGGWQLASVFSAYSGYFLTPTYSGPDISGTNTTAGRPDRLAGAVRHARAGPQSADDGSHPGLGRERRRLCSRGC